jgi:hypothetical protein
MALAACADVLDVATSVDRSDLAVLVFEPGTPAPQAIQFYVANDRTTTRTLQHPDMFNNPFAEIRFPPGSIATLGGGAAGTGDSVQVTVQPEPGTYEVSIGAPGATFSTANAPVITFFYDRYGDFTASRAGSRYTSDSELENALDVWREQLAGRYAVTPGSTPAGTGAVSGFAREPGNYLVAAPR